MKTHFSLLQVFVDVANIIILYLICLFILHLLISRSRAFVIDRFKAVLDRVSGIKKLIFARESAAKKQLEDKKKKLFNLRSLVASETEIFTSNNRKLQIMYEESITKSKKKTIMKMKKAVKNFVDRALGGAEESMYLSGNEN